MDIYIENEKGISLQEWLDYVNRDNELVLSESGEGINPITKAKLRIQIPGRVLFGDSEIHWKNSRIGSDDYSEELVAKLKEIAQAFDAEFFE